MIFILLIVGAIAAAYLFLVGFYIYSEIKEHRAPTRRAK